MLDMPTMYTTQSESAFFGEGEGDDNTGTGSDRNTRINGYSHHYKAHYLSPFNNTSDKKYHSHRSCQKAKKLYKKIDSWSVRPLRQYRCLEQAI